jgi:hypothetical protein
MYLKTGDPAPDLIVDVTEAMEKVGLGYSVLNEDIP